MTTDELRKTITEFREQLSAFHAAVSPEVYNLRRGGEAYSGTGPDTRVLETENTPLGRAHLALDRSATEMLSVLDRLARAI